MALEEKNARRNAAPRGHHGGAGPGDLSCSRLVAQLDDGLVEKAEAVGPPLGQLATVGVDRKFPVESDAATAVEPVTGFAECGRTRGPRATRWR